MHKICSLSRFTLILCVIFVIAGSFTTFISEASIPKKHKIHPDFAAALSVIEIPPIDQTLEIAKWTSIPNNNYFSIPEIEQSRWSFVSSDPLWIGRFEVTKTFFDYVMNRSTEMELSQFPAAPSSKTKQTAVTRVNVLEVEEFCQRLTDWGHQQNLLSPGYEIRFPSLFEWALALQVSESSNKLAPDLTLNSGFSLHKLPHSDLLLRYASFGDTYTSHDPHYVAQKLPFASGLYDLLGNVTEWVWTSQNGGMNYFRAGGKCNDKVELFDRLCIPYPVSPQFNSSTHGFRIVVAKQGIQSPEPVDSPTLNTKMMFRHFTKSQGLPHEHTESIHSAKDGTLWIGTPFGTARLDGDRVDTFTPTTHPGLIHDYMRWIAEDSEGRIWMASKDRVCFFENEQFYPFPESIIPAQNVRYLCSGLGNYVWFWVESGLYKISYNPDLSEQFSFEEFLIPNTFLAKRLHKIEEVAPNILFAVDFRTPLYRIHFTEKKITEITHPLERERTTSMMHFTQGPKEEIIATSDYGNFELNHYLDNLYQFDRHGSPLGMGHRLEYIGND